MEKVLKNTQNIKESKKKIFAKGNSFYKYFLIFVIGCIVGYIYETILSIFQTGSIQGRQGLLYGPFTPVYGGGAVLFVMFLKNEKDWKKIFLASCIIGGVFEYMYSFLQEYIFGTVSWDYTGFFLNIDGRTGILHALFWGIIGLAYMKWIYPLMEKVIEKIPTKIAYVITWIMILAMSLNIYLTVMSTYRQSKRLKGIEAKNGIDTFFDIYYPDEKIEQLYNNRKRVR